MVYESFILLNILLLFRGGKENNPLLVNGKTKPIERLKHFWPGPKLLPGTYNFAVDPLKLHLVELSWQ
ncbi:hypothetical protein D1970_12285 [Mesobacillus zeae]|uniref:Uncharacterized protein n=1 Tax=Mesobacillus zeae TaxID=1917180 RepID=A0A398B762_9BACI|nr:hypothetical protein D1970_12285 [Mesobacillus zeae]